MKKKIFNRFLFADKCKDEAHIVFPGGISHCLSPQQVERYLAGALDKKQEGDQ